MMDKFLKEYRDRFGEGFPMIPLGWGRTEEETIELIKKCLNANKDAYEMGFLTEDGDVLY